MRSPFVPICWCIVHCSPFFLSLSCFFIYIFLSFKSLLFLLYHVFCSRRLSVNFSFSVCATAILEYIENARTRYFSHLFGGKFSGPDVKLGVIVAAFSVQYLKPIHFPGMYVCVLVCDVVVSVVAVCCCVGGGSCARINVLVV